MRVTEKCDVYSFGVVTLEAIMGRHPAELIALLSSRAAEDQNVLLADVIDCRLASPTDETADSLLVAMRVAARCLSSDPQYRPSMLQVSQELSTDRRCNARPSLKSLRSIKLSEIVDACAAGT